MRIRGLGDYAKYSGGGQRPRAGREAGSDRSEEQGRSGRGKRASGADRRDVWKENRLKAGDIVEIIPKLHTPGAGEGKRRRLAVTCAGVPIWQGRAWKAAAGNCRAGRGPRHRTRSHRSWPFLKHVGRAGGLMRIQKNAMAIAENGRVPIGIEQSRLADFLRSLAL